VGEGVKKHENEGLKMGSGGTAQRVQGIEHKSSWSWGQGTLPLKPKTIYFVNPQWWGKIYVNIITSILRAAQ